MSLIHEYTHTIALVYLTKRACMTDLYSQLLPVTYNNDYIAVAIYYYISCHISILTILVSLHTGGNELGPGPV